MGPKNMNRKKSKYAQNSTKRKHISNIWQSKLPKQVTYITEAII